jgi:hypothetical protein
MILGLNATETILIALIPTTFTMLVGLMAWVIKRLGALGESDVRREEQLRAIERRQNELLERLR